MLYDRPLWELMADAAAAMPDRFTTADVLAWFRENYPGFKDNALQAHVLGLTANAPGRLSHKGLAPKPPVFFKLNRGVLTAFDPDRHGGDIIVPEPEPEPEAEPQGEGVSSEAADEDRMEFYLETYLEEFLRTNWHLIDWGRRLRIWEGSDGELGHQLSTPVGRIDFLCVDETTNALVVVELKRGLPSDRVVGQTARYMTWARFHLAGPGQSVEGLIVTHESDDRLQYSAAAVSGLGLLLYDVTFALRPAQLSPGPEGGA
jgi:hypothetical protein